MRKITPEEALEYHSRGRKGKIEVVPTKPCRTQEDLSLAYTPGVAEPCLEIAKDPGDGLRVHGEGEPRRRHLQRHGGPRARQHRRRSRPSRSWRARASSSSASPTSTSSTSRSTREDPKAFIETVARLEPTFGGINLEDIKAPECFEIEEALKSA